MKGQIKCHPYFKILHLNARVDILTLVFLGACAMPNVRRPQTQAWIDKAIY